MSGERRITVRVNKGRLLLEFSYFSQSCTPPIATSVVNPSDLNLELCCFRPAGRPSWSASTTNRTTVTVVRTTACA
eukprot:SAG25_NODE_1138_length_3816_cov_4.312887_11_plen_76_part_00